MLLLVISCLISCALAQNCNNILPQGFTWATVAAGRFSHIDLNGDGKITSAEYADIERREDTDADGCVTYQEFHQHYQSTKLNPVTQKLYSSYDTDNDNCLTSDGLNQDFQSMDENGDGVLGRPEYVKGYSQFLQTVLCGGGGLVG